MTTSLGRIRVATTVLVAAAMLGTACSGSGSGTTGTGGKTRTSNSGNLPLLGPVKQASGAPIKIGYIDDGQGVGVDTRPEVAAAEAAVKYVNEHLGGVAGRPLELVECATNLTPAGGTDRANKMMAAKLPVVLSPAPSQ